MKVKFTSSMFFKYVNEIAYIKFYWFRMSIVKAFWAWF